MDKQNINDIAKKIHYGEDETEVEAIRNIIKNNHFTLLEDESFNKLEEFSNNNYILEAINMASVGSSRICLEVNNTLFGRDDLIIKFARRHNETKFSSYNGKLQNKIEYELWNNSELNDILFPIIEYDNINNLWLVMPKSEEYINYTDDDKLKKDLKINHNIWHINFIEIINDIGLLNKNKKIYDYGFGIYNQNRFNSYNKFRDMIKNKININSTHYD